MALHISKSLAALLCALLMLAGSPASARKGFPQDSLPGQRELVIATSVGKPADSSLHSITPAGTSPSLSATAKKDNSTSTKDRESLNELHPQAIAFVKDYLEDNEQRLTKMKSWAGPYFVMIEQVLAKYQVPRELKYLAVIESNLKSTALSNKGAVGPWQFMPETARLYGLKVNSTRDERQDLYKSTHAAARYLRDLYRQLGDWLLVIAAYNGGDARVESAIRKAKSRDFWKLQYNLPAESRNHVKKFIATHYIMEGRGGVTTSTAEELARKENPVQDSALVAGTTTQVISGKYHSLVITKNLGMDISHFQSLNPAFDQRVSLGDYTLRLPADKMDQFRAQRQQILGESVQFILLNAEGNKEDYPDPLKTPRGKPAVTVARK